MSNNDFTRVIGELRGGLIQTDLSQRLEALTTAVQESGKKGSITLTLTLDPHGKENREIHVTAKVAVKAPPKPDLDERSIFFGVRGQLVRDDPTQRTLYDGPRGVADGSSPAEQQRDRFGTDG